MADNQSGNKKIVTCDGGNNPLGHPKVYLNFGSKDSVECPYCGKKYSCNHKN